MKQCIDQSAVMSAVIVENKMWAICFVTEAGYHVSQELLEEIALVDSPVVNTGCFKHSPIAPYRVTPLSRVLLTGS